MNIEEQIKEIREDIRNIRIVSACPLLLEKQKEIDKLIKRLDEINAYARNNFIKENKKDEFNRVD